MPKTYEQEILEIESARISADLAYHKERNITYNKQLFSKKDMVDLERRYMGYIWIASGMSAFAGALFMYIICRQ